MPALWGMVWHKTWPKMNTEHKIRQFLSRFFKVYALSSDEDIFALGFVNSLFAMQLVLFVEKEFQIKIEDRDLDMDNFRTIDALINLIERKQEAAASR